jgi:uncharacterized protein YabE (DUF348 family)
VTTLVTGYRQSFMPVTVRVDGQSRQLRTHQPTVGAFLTEAGLTLAAEDRIDPPWEAPIQPGLTIDIRRALPVELEVDGRTVVWRTQARSAAAVLQEAGIRLGPQDQVTVNGQPLRDPALPFPVAPAVPVHRLNSPVLSPGLHVRVRRAVPFELVDDGVPVTLWTTAETVGAALEAANVPLYLADRVSVPLDTPLTPGLRAVIDRSRPVTIVADGRTIATRTRTRTVAQVLAQEGIRLPGKDYTLPGVETVVAAGTVVQVVRVKQEYLVEEEKIAYETFWRPNPDLEIDHYEPAQTGVAGVKKRRIRIDYENGTEIGRQMEEEWIDRQPTPEIWNYGTRIVIRELETPLGTLRYWRKLRVLATSYSAATSGKERDHPLYGVTRLGWAAQRGVIAVDPRVINFFTQVYVPGYGIGTAVDTGGRIRGLHVDLGFDEDSLELWYRWVDVYLLDPPPAESRIRWRLPGYPPERRR